MKKTAVQWLYENILLTPLDIREINKCLEQAKAMEKEQMKALYTMHIVDTRTMELYDFEQYYNQTFKAE